MAQSNKTCPHCKKVRHSGFYCSDKPRKLPRTLKGIKSQQIYKKRKVKTQTRSQLVTQLDKVYSTYIRIKDSSDGYAECVTCHDVRPWGLMQNGHFFTRGRYSTRWDDMNCHVQCVRCNLFLKGNYIKYTTYMIDRYGRENVDILERKSLTNEKIPTPVIKDKIEEYKEKLAQMS